MIFSCSLSPVVVLVSRLFCGRRFERSEGVAHGATDDARATRAGQETAKNREPVQEVVQ